MFPYLAVFNFGTAGNILSGMGKSWRTKMQTTLDLEKVVETTFGNADYKLFINGNWRPADNGGGFPLPNPATGGKPPHMAPDRGSERPAAKGAAPPAPARRGANPPPPPAAKERAGTAAKVVARP